MRLHLAFVVSVVWSGALTAGEIRDLWYFAEQNYFASREQFAIATNVVGRASRAGYTACACITGRDCFGNWSERQSINDGSDLFVSEHAGVESWWRLSPERQARFHAYADCCRRHGIEFIPLLWSVGYGSMNLDDPSRVAAWPSRNVPYVARNGRAVFAPEKVSVDFGPMRDWGNSTNATHRRVRADVKPLRRYRLCCEMKTEDLAIASKLLGGPFISCTTEDGGRTLGMVRPRMEPTQDWTPVDFGFNADDSRHVVFSFVCPPGAGRVSARNVRLEEVGVEWPVRRAGCPFVVRDAASGRVYREGVDYAPVASLDRISFNRPKQEVSLTLLPGGAIAEGTQLLVDAYEPVFVMGVQTSSCLTNPALYDYFDRSAATLARELGPKKWFLSLDEIRVECRCELCAAAGTSMGDRLAASVVRMRETIRRHAPDAEIFMWSDMIDENHNAKTTKNGYYLCGTPFAGAWKSIPRDIVMVPWWSKMCGVCLPWLEEHGFATLGGAFYDKKTLEAMHGDLMPWLENLRRTPHARGVMYTTWQNGRNCGNYEFLEAFAADVEKFRKANAAAPQTGNLIQNGGFERDDFGIVRAWSLRDPSDVAEPEPGAGPGGVTALRLSLDKGRQYIQSGLKLVPEEPYRLSLYVRSKGYKDGAVQMMVRNPRWNRVAPKIWLPGDTKGEWRRVEATAVVPVVEEGSYYASFYLEKPTPGASLEIASPCLEAMSEKGRKGTRVAECVSTVKARILPIDPLLTELDAADAALTWYFGGFLPKAEGTYRLESSLDGGAWIGDGLPPSRRVRLSHGAVAPGRHRLDVRILDTESGTACRTNVYEAVALERGRYPEGRRLNNFVSELLARPLADGEYTFVVPRKGYVFFDLGGKDASATVSLDDAGKPLIAPSARCWSEAVRMLEAGPHRLKVRGVSSGGRTLRVHAVRPTPHHGSALHMARADVHRYLYGRDFYDTFLPLFYTECGAPRTPASRRELPAWMGVTGVPLCSEFDFRASSRTSPEAALERIRANGAFDEGLDVWLDEMGVVHPRDDHVNLGEMLWRVQGRGAVNVWWADAIRKWFDDPVTYTTETAGTVNSGGGRGSLYAEVYPGILASEEATYAQETNYIRFANSAADIVPAARRRTVFCFSGYIAPEGWNTYPAPEGDYKVFFDHFMHRLATDPAFANAGGIGSTAFQHIDEEQVRFIAKAIRHYALEGRTDSLAGRYGWKYAPGHLKNCDFAEGLKDWTAVCAEPGSVVAAEKKDYGFKVQFRREVPRGYGDRLVKMTRSAKGPNRLKQTLTGLKPGALYILTYHSTDEADVDNPGTPCRDFVLRAEFSGAEILPGLSFDRLWPEDLNDRGRRANRPNDLRKYALACTHRYVFRAKSETAELTLSDWASDREAGAPVGRTRLMNYVIVRPYYVESEKEIPAIESFIRSH